MKKDNIREEGSTHIYSHHQIISVVGKKYILTMTYYTLYVQGHTYVHQAKVNAMYTSGKIIFLK